MTDQKTKRVSITLSEKDYDVLAEYARLVGSPPTTVVKDLVVELLPTFKYIISAMALADANLNQGKHALNQVLLDKINDVNAVSNTLSKEINNVSND